MKRTLSLLLAVALLCGLLPMGAMTTGAASGTGIAYPVEGGNIYFDKETGTITSCDSTITSADIPAEIDGVAVTSVGWDAFSSRKQLTSVTLPDSITSFGQRVFMDCTMLQKVILPKHVESMGSNTFANCSSLTEVTLPEDLTSIGWYDFFGCGSLQSITIPDSVTSINSSAFQNCTSLLSVVIPDSVDTIGNYAFSGCSSLAEVKLPNGLTYINSTIFEGCTSLAEVTIPDSIASIPFGVFGDTALYADESRWKDGVLYIGNWLIEAKKDLSGTYTLRSGTVGIADSAFYNCDSLSGVVISEGVQTIGSNVFWGCSGLSEVGIPDSVTTINSSAFSGTAAYNDENNRVDNAVYIDHWLIDGMDVTGEFSVLPGTVGIAREAFCENWDTGSGAELTTLTIPDSVLYINSYAFAKCSNLEKINFGSGVKTIDGSAFWSCTGLTELALPASLESIGGSAFSSCNITKLELPAGLTYIGASAFESTDLTEVSIASNVTFIGEDAFDCDGLTGIWVDEANLHYSSDDRGVLFDKGKTQLIYVPRKLEGAYTIPGTVTDIGYEKFAYREHLTAITISESVSYIDHYAFFQCENLTAAYFKGDAPSIGNFVFSTLDSSQRSGGAGGLTKNLGLTLYYIEGKEGWTSPTWNGYPTATWIPGKGIAYPVEGGNIYFDKETGTITSCDSTITSADIPAEIDGVAVTAIGVRAFDSCGSLVGVTIPDSVTSIGMYAFANCGGLTSVMLGNGVTNIEAFAFSNCPALISIELPVSLTNMGAYVFNSCSGLTEINVAAGNSAYASENGVLFNKDKTELVIYPEGKTETEYTVPDSVKIIGFAAFSGNDHLKTATVSDSVTTLGERAFEACSGLEAVTMPPVAENIGAYAFMGCSSLTIVRIPHGIQRIETETFYGCASLGSISIPASVTSIGNQAFASCDSLTRVYFSGDAPELGNNVFEKKEDLTLYYCGGTEGWTSPTWNGYPTSAREGILAYPAEGGYIYFEKETGTITGCGMGVTKADIPAQIDGVDVVYIGDYAFRDCTNLTSVNIPEGVKYIDTCAFVRCTSLQEVNLPEGLKIIYEGAFAGCTSLTEIYIPDSVTEIWDQAFLNCTALTDIHMGDNVTWVGFGAFEETAYYNDKDNWTDGGLYVGNWFIAVSEGLTELEIIPGTVGLAAGSATPGSGRKITRVVLPDSLEYILSSNFNGFPISSVVIPEKVSYIGQYAFDDCTNLKDVYFCGPAPEVWNAFHCHVDGPPYIVSNVTFYYIEGQAGWTSPEWNGYPTATWEPHEHDYTAVVTAPTCTEQGYTTYTCECGDSYVADYVDALGHAYADGACTRCGKEDPDYVPEVPPVEFSDVSDSAWYAEAVDYAVNNALMNGTGNNKFEPESSMTRAMLVTVLWRYAGEPLEGENSFTDVPAGQWYTEAVAWAAENGIVGGVGDGKFDPNGKITREQMAAILFRYCNSVGIDTTKRAELSAFPDGGKVSAYATDALSWAVAEGLVTGSKVGNTVYLDPQGSATRAQVATILMRFIENVVE